MDRDTKPALAISLGDPAGISPEIVAASLRGALGICRPVVFGHWPSLKRALDRADPGLAVARFAPGDRLPGPAFPDVAVVDCGPGKAPIREPDDRSAEAQFAALEQAAGAVLSGDCDGLVTGPVSKAQMARRLPGFIGHTEYLAGRCSVDPDAVTMLFASDQLSVGLVSTHLALARAAASVTRPRLERTLGHLRRLLADLGHCGKGRIGVAALNPHAGEGGLLGAEEAEVIGPFCRSAAGDQEFDVEGPVPADALFRDALAGRYQGIIAMYHDQAMIPLKLFGLGQRVNVTMGLPFVRTSPDHGVAYDIAGQGRADPAGMGLAIRLAARLAAGKK